ncbi:thiamine phosphate synthase [Sphingobacterium lactis]|uniref:thiamine phosphate synthase n=1 Tax=Sphingobacterium lactis TaxID=797291 RepID=UPI003EC8985D
MPIHPNFPYPLYLVISEKDCVHLPWLQVAEEAIRGGVDIIQLREKELDTATFIQRATALKALTDRYGIPLVINDNVEVASAVDAWGIHVGRTDRQPQHIQEEFGHRFQIGWSLELLEQLQDHNMDFVQHLGVSPIFPTPTKTNTITAWGMQGIRDLRTHTDKPLIAIGGMHLAHANEAFTAGANSIAVVSAICSRLDPRKAAEELKNSLS